MPHRRPTTILILIALTFLGISPAVAAESGPSMSALISGTAPRAVETNITSITSEDLALPAYAGEASSGPAPIIPSQAPGNAGTDATAATTATNTPARNQAQRQAKADQSKRDAMDKACAPVVTACVKARFGVGLAGRDLLKDCVDIITDYKTVAGTAPPALAVTNCRIARRHVEEGIAPPKAFIPQSEQETENVPSGFQRPVSQPVNAMVKRPE